MSKFENVVLIQRPVGDVFAYLADFRNIPRWNYAIERTWKTSSGPVGVGSTYSQVRTIPNRSEEAFEVTIFEPGRRLAIRGQLGPFRATMAYVLEAVPDGTRLTNRAELQLSSGMLRAAGPLVTHQVKTAVARNLNALKQLMENPAGPGRPLWPSLTPRS